MRIILGTIAAAAVLVGIAAQPAQARCAWNGYAWVCNQHERFVDRDRFDRDRFDRDRFDRRDRGERFGRFPEIFSGGERHERRHNWQWGY